MTRREGCGPKIDPKPAISNDIAAVLLRRSKAAIIAFMAKSDGRMPTQQKVDDGFWGRADYTKPLFSGFQSAKKRFQRSAQHKVPYRSGSLPCWFDWSSEVNECLN
ncbi:hypothetical protein [Roseovarius sp.]|uniref:hypothetical protein n=1 Tax=Roseovarius sp. TaxID=1486281 RepID=UPI0035650E1B